MAFCSIGLGQLQEGAAYAEQLGLWTGTILGVEGTATADRIYELAIRCPPGYPEEPPEVRFVTQINLDGVQARTGAVSRALLGAWVPEHGMVGALCAIRAHMVGLRKAQPAANLKFQ